MPGGAAARGAELAVVGGEHLVEGGAEALGRAAAEDVAKTCRNSFAGATPVLMADGTMKPIQNVKAGDKVRNAEPGNSKTQIHPVAALQDPPYQPEERQHREVSRSGLQIHRGARMTRRGAKQKYHEGDWFAVPLDDGRYALGLIARSAKNSQSILFGYFFGPARDSVPQLSDVVELRPADAIWLKMFGDVGLHDGTWPVLGQASNWNRDAWTMPAFAHEDALIPGRYERREYPNEDPGSRPVKKRIDANEAASLPDDGLGGAKLVKARLTKLLS